MRDMKSVGLLLAMLLGGYAVTWVTLRGVFPDELSAAPVRDTTPPPGLAIPSNASAQAAASAAAPPAPAPAAPTPATPAVQPATNTLAGAAPQSGSGWQPDSSWTQQKQAPQAEQPGQPGPQQAPEEDAAKADQ